MLPEICTYIVINIDEYHACVLVDITCDNPPTDWPLSAGGIEVYVEPFASMYNPHCCSKGGAGPVDLQSMF